MELLGSYFDSASTLNLPINWEKSAFLTNSLTFCGFTIDDHGYTCRENYIIQVEGIPEPTTKKQVQILLGMFNWVRDFVPGYEDLMHLIRKCIVDGPFKWTLYAKNAFYDCLSILKKTRLIFFEGGPYEVYTDASGYAIGGTVYDKGRSCGLFSKALVESERRYCTFEKEMFAIEHCFLKFGKFFGQWSDLKRRR